jgi:hypothetical protein
MASSVARARAAALAFLLASAAVAVPAGAPPAFAQDVPKRGERWNGAATRDLRVLAQAPPRRVEELARGLALARAAVLAIAGAPDHEAPHPTVVLAFRDDAALAAYHRSAGGAPPSDPLLATLDRQGRLIAFA